MNSLTNLRDRRRVRIKEETLEKDRLRTRFKEGNSPPLRNDRPRTRFKEEDKHSP